MGTRGPLPKSKRKSGLKFAVGVPDAPEWLDDPARAEYARVVEMLAETPDHLQQVDLSTLATYAQAYADVCRLTKDVRDEGETLVSPAKGTSYLNPKCSALSAAYNRMREAAAKLGFSPADRARVNGKAPAGKASGNPVHAYI